jgi:hypothetical protein
MTRMMLLATALVTGCVDQPEHDVQAPLAPDKPTHGTIEPRLYDALLAQILTTPGGAAETPPAVSPRYEATWVETLAAPEACGDCTLQVLHTVTRSALTLEVVTATGDSMCAITARRLGAGFEDSCGALAE